MNVNRFVPIFRSAAKLGGAATPAYLLSATPAASALPITTYDGSGECLHPCVVYFDSPWNGHRWWMAITPYPNSSAFENPCIYYSDNGTTWSDSGITNPISPNPGGGGHNADTHLIYNASDDKLYCYWTERYPGTSYKVLVKSSSNGITWSAASTCISLNEAVEGSASPSVLLDGGVYKMWVNDYIASPNIMKLWTCDTPDGAFEFESNCIIHNQPAEGNIAAGREIWHLGVTKLNGYYYAVLNFCQVGASGQNTTLNFAISDNGINWYTHNGFFHNRGDVAWSNDPYRGVLVEEGETLWCYYSGFNVALDSGWSRAEVTRTETANLISTSSAYRTLCETAQIRIRGNGSPRDWKTPYGGQWNGTAAYDDFFVDGVECIDLTGTNSITLTRDPSPSGSFTISMWWKKTQATDGTRNSVLWGRSLAGSFSFDHSNAAFRECLAFNNGVWVNSLKLNGVIGEWHHYAAVFDHGANTVTLYRDGVSVGSVTKGTLTSGQHFGLGQIQAGGIAFGKIAECMYFPSALSPADVLLLTQPTN